jgi:hypothetical protein
VKPQPAPTILSQESVHTTLSITHHTRKRPSTGPRTTHGHHRVLGLISFDCHPGSPFFSHRRRTLLLLISVFSFRHHSLSLSVEGHSYSDNNTRSLSLLRRSLARSVCSDVPVSLSCSPPPAARALRIVLNFSPQKAGATADRPATCATTKGSRADVDRVVLRAVAVAATPPPILLLGHAHLVESPRPCEN